MSLNIGFEVAKSALSSTSRQTEVVSRNIGDASDPGATRKVTRTISDPVSGVIATDVVRIADEALLSRSLSAASRAGGDTAVATLMADLNAIAGSGEDGTSPGSLLSEFSSGLITYAATPEDDVSAAAAVASAGRLAEGISRAAADVQSARQAADDRIAEGVSRLNGLLEDFGRVDTEIVARAGNGLDATDLLDERDQLLKSIASEVSIQTTTRPDNSSAIFLSNGVTLFDRSPRSVSFSPTAALPSGAVGNDVYIDGVPISGAGVAGSLSGSLEARDGVGLTYARQLDEMARALVSQFAETDQTAPPSNPPRPGLFTAPGLTTIPDETAAVGLAVTLIVNPAIDPAVGGDPTRLRDGGATGPSDPIYIAVSEGAAGYTERLRGLIAAFDTPQAVSGLAQLGDALSVNDLFSQSSGWVSSTYQTATQNAEANEVLHARANEALSSQVGVNLDQELTSLLELERSYEAAARLMTVIDGMYDDLFRVTG